MLKKLNLKEYKWLYLIFLMALLVRLIGINHGFPFIFHPDEPAVVRAATGIRFKANPGHFDWPHLHLYINYAVYFIFIKIRGLLQFLKLQQVLSPIFPIIWRDPLVFYGISRILDAFLGALTVIPVYLAGKNLFTKKVGILSALSLAIIPFHVHTSHFALIDIPMTFWVAWALYFSTRICKSKNVNNYLIAGLFIGFAASTKYNGGLLASVVFFAHLYRVLNSDKKRLLDMQGLRNLFLSGIAALFGFLLGTPYALFDSSTFLRSDGPSGAMWQFKNVGKVGFYENIYQFFNNITSKLPDDFGYTLLISYFVVGIHALYKKNLKLLFLFLPSFFIFYYVSGFAKPRSHYFMGVYPFVAIISGYASFHLWERAKAFGKYASYGLLTLFFIFPLYFTFMRVYTISQKDTRILLYEWMQERVGILDYLIYDSSSVGPVMEKFSDNPQKKGFLSELETRPSSGYVIRTFSNAELSSFLENDYMNDSLDSDKILFSAKGRYGPNIFVYSLEKL